MLWVLSKSTEKVHERAHAWIVDSMFTQDHVPKLLQQSLQGCGNYHWSRYIIFILSKSDCDCDHRVFYTYLQQDLSELIKHVFLSGVQGEVSGLQA